MSNQKTRAFKKTRTAHLESRTMVISWSCDILGLSPHDKMAMLVDKTTKFFEQKLHEKRVKFPAKGKA